MDADSLLQLAIASASNIVSFEANEPPRVLLPELSASNDVPPFPERAFDVMHVFQWSFLCRINEKEPKREPIVASTSTSPNLTLRFLKSSAEALLFQFDASVWSLNDFTLSRDVWNVIFGHLALETLSRLRATCDWLRVRVDAFLTTHIRFDDDLMIFSSQLQDVVTVVNERENSVVVSPVMVGPATQFRVRRSWSSISDRGFIPKHYVPRLFFVFRSMSFLCQQAFFEHCRFVAVHGELVHVREELKKARLENNAAHATFEMHRQNLKSMLKQMRRVSFSSLRKRVSRVGVQKRRVTELSNTISALVKLAFMEVLSSQIALPPPASGWTRSRSPGPQPETDRLRKLKELAEPVNPVMKIALAHAELKLFRNFDIWFSSLMEHYAVYAQFESSLRTNKASSCLEECYEVLERLQNETLQFSAYSSSAKSLVDQLCEHLRMAQTLQTQEANALEDANETLQSGKYFARQYQQHLANTEWPPGMADLKSRIEENCAELAALEVYLAKSDRERETLLWPDLLETPPFCKMRIYEEKGPSIVIPSQLRFKNTIFSVPDLVAPEIMN